MTQEEIKAKFESFRCRHGLKRNRNKDGSVIKIAGGIGHCECCGTSFGTLASDRKMCPECKKLEQAVNFV